MTPTAAARTALALMQAPTASRLDNVMVAETAADNAMNADAPVVETQVTQTAEARTALALMQAPAASRVDSVMVAEAATDNAMNTDATGGGGIRETNSRGTHCTRTDAGTDSQPCRQRNSRRSSSR